MTPICSATRWNTYTFDNVVKTIDTQNVANTVGAYGRGNKIGLGALCAHHGFEFRDSHTAGNDTAYTLFNAIFMALKQELLAVGSAGSGKSAQDVINTIEI